MATTFINCTRLNTAEAVDDVNVYKLTVDGNVYYSLNTAEAVDDVN